jgi:hypothetical protein
MGSARDASHQLDGPPRPRVATRLYRSSPRKRGSSVQGRIRNQPSLGPRLRGDERVESVRHARAWPAHPRLYGLARIKTWMAGMNPAMTGWNALRHRCPSPFIPAKAGIQRKGLHQKSTKPGSPRARGRTDVKQPSCPRLSRASTSVQPRKDQDVDGRDEPGHDGLEWSASSLPFSVHPRASGDPAQKGCVRNHQA